MCGTRNSRPLPIGAVGAGGILIRYPITARDYNLRYHRRYDDPRRPRNNRYSATISGIVHHLSFVWSKTPSGYPGKDGVDADMLDWSRSGIRVKTLSSAQHGHHPKLFAGTKTATAPSRDSHGLVYTQYETSSGTIAAEAVNGIYGFRDDYKTLCR